ncbi:hypothetical protein K7432_001665 [Basidiobolus ranarum]|uniref:WAPL domain-containing protein n=1 Tax=Basidiobolus ranarum TaxID=34480 RepID=A0ABR2X2P7_9FUNG
MSSEFGLRNREIKIRFGKRNRKSISNFTNTTTVETDIWNPAPSIKNAEKATESRGGEGSRMCSEYVSLIKRVRERKQVTNSVESITPKKSTKSKKSLTPVRTATGNTKKTVLSRPRTSSPFDRVSSSTMEFHTSTVEVLEDSQSSLEDIFANFLGSPTTGLSPKTTPKSYPTRLKIAHSLKRAHTDSEYSIFKSKRTNLFGDFDEEEDNVEEDTWTPVLFTDKIPVRNSVSTSETSKLSVADVMKPDLDVDDPKETEINSVIDKSSCTDAGINCEKEAKAKGKKSTKTYRQKKDDALDIYNSAIPTFPRAKTDLDATPRKSILARKQLLPHADSNAMLRARTFTEGEGGWDEDTVERDLVDDDDVDENSMDLKSQHELRELGESKRFNDEMEYVLDGLDPTQSLSVRRTSGLELARKLLSSSFSMKLRAHNCIPKIYELLREQNDPIVLACRAFMLCLLMQDKRNLEFLPLEDHCMELLMELLTIKPDPLAQLDWGSTKSEKRLINELRDIVVISRVTLTKNTISVKALAARALLSIVSRKARNEEVIRERMRESGILEVVCCILEEKLKPMEHELSISSHVKLNCSEFLETTPYLRILESATQFCLANQDIVAQNENIHRRLLILALFFQVEATSEDFEKAILAMDSISGIFRLLINLSNEHEECSRLISEAPGLSIVMQLLAFSQSTPVNSIDTSLREALSASKYDISLLSIGLLINIVDANIECKNTLRETEFCINDTCHTKFSVLCRCSKKLALEYLTEFYVRIQNGTNSTEHNVLVAYVALLLGCLMKQNEQNQRFIVSLLPERSVHSLISILEEFLQFNEVIGGGSVSQAYEFASIAELEKAATGEPPDDKPKSIADSFNEIVSFLKTLLK